MRKTRTAHITLEDDGVLVVRITQQARQSLDDARENLEAVIAIAGGVKRPLLVDISVCDPVDAQVRHQYTGDLLANNFSAIALRITSGPFGRIMGNVYLRVLPSKMPARLFGDDDSARAWLHGFIGAGAR